MKTVKTKYDSILCLEAREVVEINEYLKSIAYKVKELVTLDRGPCVLGNKIFCYVVPPRCRNPVKQTLFINPWSQDEQYSALQKMIEFAVEHHPHFVGAIHYDCGIVD